jgi:hypothetical protein
VEAKRKSGSLLKRSMNSTSCGQPMRLHASMTIRPSRPMRVRGKKEAGLGANPNTACPSTQAPAALQATCSWWKTNAFPRGSGLAFDLFPLARHDETSHPGASVPVHAHVTAPRRAAPPRPHQNRPTSGAAPAPVWVCGDFTLSEPDQTSKSSNRHPSHIAAFQRPASTCPVAQNSTPSAALP